MNPGTSTPRSAANSASATSTSTTPTSARGRRRLGHAFFGYIDVIGRQNIIDLHPGFELQLARSKRYFERLSLRGDYHVFWRESNRDAVYNAAGGVLRASGANRDQFIGSEADLLLNWQIGRHVSGYLGYSHFFAGDFIAHTGAHPDIDFAYAALQFTF